jgi:transglutaminase-like putative cysteine protease
MYDIRQFKPAIYLLVIFGVTGFAVAAEEPGMWVLAMGGILINSWLVWRNKFRPIPRWLANFITLGAFWYVTYHVLHVVATPILLIGQFLVLLQIVKLFEQRANRDYAQLIVLSWLLMVAAAISTASLIFAILFFAHLLLLLYGCLLYHLRVETDRARAAQIISDDRVNLATLRQDQRHLPRSMRRLTGLVAVVSMTCAVVVFLFFPRGAGAGMFGQFQLHPPEVLTGFSDDVQMNQIAKITQNNTPVATVHVTHNGELVRSGSLRLRGSTFDRYFFDKITGESRWENSRHHAAMGRNVAAGDEYEDRFKRLPPLTDEWRQTVRLDPIGSKALFALPGIHSLRVKRDSKIAYYQSDETMQRTEALHLPLEYEVVSNNTLTAPTPAEMDNSRFGKLRATIREAMRGDKSAAQPDDAAATVAPENDEITTFARDPAVAGANVLKRPYPAILTEYDEEIARSIEQYFKANFEYTLDLTDVASLFEGRDPLAVFVSQTRRGHCQYFAGAMTLACQRLGLQARMVVGFNTDEYNSYSEVFQVRQSHAHAWVEVLTTAHGWVTFDPTSGREYPPNESRSSWQVIKHVFEWMEFKWGTSVVAYDGNRRENLIQRLDNSLVNTAFRGQDKATRVSRWWDHITEGREFWSVSSRLLGGFILLMGMAIVLLILWFIIERARIRRRAIKIGLDALPMNEQMRLARQLGFYEEMMEILQNHRMARPRHMTPHEFSQTLSFLPTEAYKTVDRLTRIFYRVRFGGSNVQPGQQRRLARMVERLQDSLGPAAQPPSKF